MFVSHTHKFVLVTPARCGSRFLHNWIRKQPELYRPDVNKMIDQAGGWIHHSYVPGHAKQYPVVMTVRPPRDRTLSIYKHRWFFSARDAWDLFIERQKKENVNIWFHTFYQFAQRCQPQFLIRLTHLKEDLRALPMLTGVEYTPPEDNYRGYDEVQLPPEREQLLRDYIATDLAWLAAREVSFAATRSALFT